MNPLLQRRMELDKALRNGEPIDQYRDVIQFALDNSGDHWRIPFKRESKSIIVGNERFKMLQGAAIFRVTLMQGKSQVWHKDSTVGRKSAFEVYCTTQDRPRVDNERDEDGGNADGYGNDLVYDRVSENSGFYDSRKGSVIGPSFSGSRQQLMMEAPPDRKGKRVTSAQSLREYAYTLSEIDTLEALDQLSELDSYFRENSMRAAKQPKGDVLAAADAFLKDQTWQGQGKAFTSEHDRIEDCVRHAAKYFLHEKLFKSHDPLTLAIAEHLDEFVHIGAYCEYRGDWRFIF